MLLMLLACTPDPDKNPGGDDSATPGDAPTWYQDVAPIVVENCSGCHSPSGPGFDLSDYAHAAPMAAAMANATSAGRMPPWGAKEDENCAPTTPWKDDRRISEEQIATLAAWAEADAPEGDPASAAPTNDPKGVGLEDYDLEIGFVQPYFTQGDADELICFSMDPQTSTWALLSGIEVVPGNESIAHHALVFADPTGASGALAGADGWYDCGSGSGVNVPQARLLATWVPGAPPTRAPEGTAIPFEAGARVLVQMHYHPGGKVGEEDNTQLRVKLAEGIPTAALYQTLVGNFFSEATGLAPGPNDRGAAEFRIPANVKDHTETMNYVVPDGVTDLPLVSFGAHMHLAGVSLSVKVNGQSDDQCLLNVPAYDYDWQQLYDYDAGLDDVPTVSGGDVVTVQCTYDNTLDNPGVQRALAEYGYDEPQDIYLGEGTMDEMCLAMVGFVYSIR